MNKATNFFQLYLRFSIGLGFLIFGLDRLGVWGGYGTPGVSWGDWKHFMDYASSVMGFLPYSLANVLAIIATAAEIGVGLLLILGLWTRLAALAGGLLALSFAVSMAISFGVIKPMAYSVFTVSAASFLLSSVEKYKWSIDHWLRAPSTKATGTPIR